MHTLIIVLHERLKNDASIHVATESNGAQLENRVEHIKKQNERILQLVKAVRDHQKKVESQRFSIDDSPYKV